MMCVDCVWCTQVPERPLPWILVHIIDYQPLEQGVLDISGTAEIHSTPGFRIMALNLKAEDELSQGGRQGAQRSLHANSGDGVRVDRCLGGSTPTMRCMSEHV